MCPGVRKVVASAHSFAYPFVYTKASRDTGREDEPEAKTRMKCERERGGGGGEESKRQGRKEREKGRTPLSQSRDV